LRQLFANKGLAYPPRTILLRTFKKEAQLESWVEDWPGKPYLLLKSYSICATSGVLGPKRKLETSKYPKDSMNWTGLIRKAISI
jgi:murein L,D-transpeptidase YafK